MDSDGDMNASQREEAEAGVGARKRKLAIESIQLDGGLEEVIRVPQSLQNFDAESVLGDYITEGNQTGHNVSTNMSMFASVIMDKGEESKKLRKSQIPMWRKLGLAEAKKTLI